MLVIGATTYPGSDTTSGRHSRYSVTDALTVRFTGIVYTIRFKHSSHIDMHSKYASEHSIGYRFMYISDVDAAGYIVIGVCNPPVTNQSTHSVT
jgi:hypothetical protein